MSTTSTLPTSATLTGVEDSSSSTLPPEVYVQIIYYLHRPLPKRNGRNLRSAIRQPDLAALMRVSKILNTLTALTLYSEAVVDDISLFAYNITRRSSAVGIPSKSELLTYTRRLFIEYGEKREPTYLQVMQKGKEAISGICPDRLGETTILHREMLAALQAASQLLGVLRLKSVSTSIFLGRSSHDWHALVDNPAIADLPNLILGVQSAMSRFYIDPHPAHFCDRGIYGPLTFLSTTNAPVNHSASGRRHCAHLDTVKDPVLFPAHLGGHTDILFSLQGPHDPGVKEGMLYMLEVIRRQMEVREHAGKRTPGDHRGALSLDLYVPSAWIKHPKWYTFDIELPRRIRFYRRELGIPESFYLNDSFKVKTLEDAPVCASCGWDPENWRDGQA